MIEALKVEKREAVGKLNNRRLRAAGHIPAVVYGHGKESVSISVSANDLDAVIRHGSRAVRLTGAVNESAFIKECQWNTWGTEILHVDFHRVSEHEKIDTAIPVELRGEAPGTKDGGVVKHILHELEIECEALAIPEKIVVNINSLELDGSIAVSDLEIPEGVVVKIDPATAVVQCVIPVEAPEEEGEAGEEEPEVIGRKAEGESEE